MKIKKANILEIEKLSNCTLEKQPKRLDKERKIIKDKSKDPKVLEWARKLRAKGFQAYINPQTGFIIATTAVTGVLLCIRPEKNDNFDVSMINRTGHSVGGSTRTKQLSDLDDFIKSNNIAPEERKVDRSTRENQEQKIANKDKVPELKEKKRPKVIEFVKRKAKRRAVGMAIGM